jgi:hypothetical protein
MSGEEERKGGEGGAGEIDRDALHPSLSSFPPALFTCTSKLVAIFLRAGWSFFVTRKWC